MESTTFLYLLLQLTLILSHPQSLQMLRARIVPQEDRFSCVVQMDATTLKSVYQQRVKNYITTLILPLIETGFHPDLLPHLILFRHPTLFRVTYLLAFLWECV